MTPDSLLLWLSAWPPTDTARCALRDAALRHATQLRVARQRATELGVGPLADSVLRDAAWDLLPEVDRESIDTATRANAAHVALVVRDLASITARLLSAGIEPVVFKGPVLASQVFGHHRRRPGGDIDLLVEATALDAAVELIREAGYVERGPAVAVLRRRQHAVTLDPALPGVRPEIDLHFAFTGGWVSQLPQDWRRRWTQSVDLDGLSLRTFTPPLAALHAVLHLAAHGYRFRQAADLAGWDRMLTPAHRLQVRDLAREAGCEGHALHGLTLVRQLWGAPEGAAAGSPLPEASATAYARSAFLRDAGAVPAAVMRATPLRNGYIRETLRTLGADQRGRALQGLVRNAFFPGREYLQWRYGDGGAAALLARPFRALARFVRELGSR